jgi:hypothetical protein
MRSEKGYSLILVIIVIVLVLGAGLIYFKREKLTSYVPAGNPSPSEMLTDQDADSVNINEIDKELSNLESDASEL